MYRSREMSGRALVPFVMINEVPHTVLSLLKGLPDSTSLCIRQNNIHGTLLQDDRSGVFLSISKSLSFPSQAVGGCSQYFEQ